MKCKVASIKTASFCALKEQKVFKICLEHWWWDENNNNNHNFGMIYQEELFKHIFSVTLKKLAEFWQIDQSWKKTDVLCSRILGGRQSGTEIIPIKSLLLQTGLVVPPHLSTAAPRKDIWLWVLLWRCGTAGGCDGSPHPSWRGTHPGS